MNCICENCGKEIIEDYRVHKNLKTARFCSKSCKCAFNGRKAPGFQKGHPNYNSKLNSILNSNLNLPCPYCGKTFGNAGGLQRHIYGCKLNPNYEEIKASGKYTTNIHNENWKEAMKKLKFTKPLSPEICRYCGREFSYKDHCHRHEKYCKENPNRIPALSPSSNK